jgi:hypothetical protein
VRSEASNVGLAVLKPIAIAPDLHRSWAGRATGSAMKDGDIIPTLHQFTR